MDKNDARVQEKTGNEFWVEEKDGVLTLRFTQAAQEEVGTIMYAELPLEEQTLKKGDVLVSVEGDKAVTEFLAPVSMKIVQWNTQIEENPEQLHAADPANNWIVSYTHLLDTSVR